jgi:hypothetical protein
MAYPTRFGVSRIRVSQLMTLAAMSAVIAFASCRGASKRQPDPEYPRINAEWRFSLPREDDEIGGLTCGDLHGDGSQQAIVGAHYGQLLLRGFAAAPPSVWRKASRTPRIVASDVVSEAGVLNAAGKLERVIPTGLPVDAQQVARRRKGALIFGVASGPTRILAYDDTGRFAWRYAGSRSTAVACSVDIGDPAGDAIAVGYTNGDLCLLSSKGIVLRMWHGLGEVVCLAPARFTAAGTRSVLCLTTAGRLIVASRTGFTNIRVQVSPRATSLLCADLDGDGVDEIIVQGPSALRVYGADGSPRWSYRTGSSSAVTEGRFGSDARLAVSEDRGVVAFLTADGKLLGKRRVSRYLRSLRTLAGGAKRADRVVALTVRGCVCFDVPSLRP